MNRKKYTLNHEVDILESKNKKEIQAVKELRTSLEDLSPLPEDSSLIKWLKARNFDVKKAETMYRNSIAYCEKMKVDTILEDFKVPEVLTQYFPGGMIGRDKEGRPIQVELHGRMDLRGLVYSVRQPDMERYKLCSWEKLMKMCREKGVDGCTVIADMDGMSLKLMYRPGVQMYMGLLKVLEDNYPEMLKRMLIINAPRVFLFLYRLVRPLLSDETKQKMQVLGSDYSKTLLQYIDADVLPACYGGNKTDPDGDPKCPSMINPGGIIPEEFYLKEMLNSDTLQTATVARGDRLSLDFHITKPGSVLRWEFKTDGYDIGFGVFRKEGDSKVTILDTDRVKSHVVPEEGNTTCDVTGTYTLVFDNCFSWARGKQVHYNIEVIDPADTEETTSDLSKMLKDGLTLNDVMKKEGV